MDYNVDHGRKFSILHNNIMTKLFPVLTIIGILLFSGGIVLLCNMKNMIQQPQVYNVEYENCLDVDGKSCKEYVVTKTGLPCSCYFPVNISQDMLGQVTLYYELDTLDQTESSYANSRDMDQLKGILNEAPSTDCGAYRYNMEASPVYPCGAIADSMFNDTFTTLFIFGDSGYKYMPITKAGLIPDSWPEYHNIPEDQEQYFVQPKSWPKRYRLNVWESPDDYGVENTAFRIWMNTDLKRKPVWRLNHSDPEWRNLSKGLPKGEYWINIRIHYPPARYNGTRRIILESISEPFPIISETYRALGIVGLLSGLVLFAAAAYTLWKNYRDKRPKRDPSDGADTELRS